LEELVLEPQSSGFEGHETSAIKGKLSPHHHFNWITWIFVSWEYRMGLIYFNEQSLYFISTSNIPLADERLKDESISLFRNIATP